MSDIMYDRVVVKVGTSTLTYDTGKLNLQRMDKLARVISDIKNRGAQVVLVSSGAVAAGSARVNFDGRPANIQQKQALAAIGQPELMRMYDRFFTGYGHQVAQMLLTKSVVDNEEPRENARNTFRTLFEMGVLPVVNENDSISYHGVKFGGNDTLAAYVALLSDAKILINLSDINGLYDKNPREHEDANIIKSVKTIDDSIYKMAGGEGTARGTGGMKTKIDSAKMVTEAGIAMVIANGADPDILYDILAGKNAGTLFYPVI